MNAKFINSIYKTIIFVPLLLYFGKRSYIAYDEGFYALQARWMLQNKNWVIPVWLDQYVLEMTPSFGKDFSNLNELKPNKYAWMIESTNKISKSENYQITANNKNLNPWKIIKKKYKSLFLV